MTPIYSPGLGILFQSWSVHWPSTSALFESAIEKGQTLPEPANAGMATAVAAVQASRLRLIARAAGDKVISFMDREQTLDLEALGVDCTAQFPERPFLEKHYQANQCGLSIEWR